MFTLSQALDMLPLLLPEDLQVNAQLLAALALRCAKAAARRGLDQEGIETVRFFWKVCYVDNDECSVSLDRTCEGV